MRIALIAHDDEKDELVDWVRSFEDVLEAHELIATGATADRLADGTGLAVEQLVSGARGRDMMIGSAVVTDDCHAVFFFRDPMTAQPHDPDISALLRICDVHDVPLATNRTSATAMLTGLADGAA